MIEKEYKGYVIEINESKNCTYVIKKDNKIVVKSNSEFPFPSEAEVDAKLMINKISASNSGWMVS